MRTRFLNIFPLLCYFRHELERVWGSPLRCNSNTFFHGLEIELGNGYKLYFAALSTALVDIVSDDNVYNTQQNRAWT